MRRSKPATNATARTGAWRSGSTSRATGSRSRRKDECPTPVWRSFSSLSYRGVRSKVLDQIRDRNRVGVREAKRLSTGARGNLDPESRESLTSLERGYRVSARLESVPRRDDRHARQ